MAETSFLWRDTAMRIRERFNPHAPFEARRRSLLQRSSCWANFNPRAPCGARHGADRERLGARRISTHAPLAGRDDSIGGSLAVQQDFNPRAPCGARHCLHGIVGVLELFQPTRPLRGATFARMSNSAMMVVFQPTRPLRGATWVVTSRKTMYGEFQPTRPLRGATKTFDGRYRR